MDLEVLQRKLVGAARKRGGDDSVPYAFEKRIMARLGESQRVVLDPVRDWSLGLWKAAFSCLAITVVVGICAYSIPSEPVVDDLGAALEEVVLTTVDEPLEAL